MLRLPAGFDTLVTTDFTLEGVHFRREWHPADAVGHRCLTRGLSDIASMGGEPVAAFLSLAVPAEMEQSWIDDFFAGLHALANTFNIPLAGGDIAQSPRGIMADITVMGAVPKGKAIYRSGAKDGDRLFVTGELGAPVALLKQMFENPEKKFRAKSYPAHFYPMPQIAVGRYLRERGLATAMIDISDGLSTDLSHICEESGVGAIVNRTAIPRASVGRHEVPLKDALHGGDEYQLLFTCPPGKRLPKEIAGVAVSHIGYITPDKGEVMLTPDVLQEGAGYPTELVPGGWEHFTDKTPGKKKK